MEAAHCPECGEEVAGKIEACPHCGAALGGEQVPSGGRSGDPGPEGGAGELTVLEALNPMKWTGLGLVWVVVGIYFLFRTDPIYSLAVAAFCFPPLTTYCRRNDLELWKQVLVFSAVILFVILPVMWLEARLIPEDQNPGPDQETAATVVPHTAEEPETSVA